MKRIKGFSSITLIAAVLLVVVLSQPAFPWTNGQDAFLVIGQPDFVTGGGGTTATTFFLPVDVAIDTAHGKLYVADQANHRVLRYGYPVAGNQPAAELVFGQPDFTSNAAGITRNTFDNVTAIEVDADGRLWVSDRNNHRVIWFNDAYAIAVNQPNADGVLGQPDFTSKVPATTRNGMNAPYDMAFNLAGTLFLAEQSNHRVLRFDNAAAKPNGANADGVLGQPDFTSNVPALTQSGMNQPRGVALIGAYLFVADRSNARVLRFDNAAAKPNGANADGVLGQPDFTSNAKVCTQAGMDAPGRVAASGATGSLYVSDGFNNNRVLVFDMASQKTDGAPADFVLGQPDFVTAGSGLARNRLDLDSSAGGMAVADYSITIFFIADYKNNRVLLFVGTTAGGGGGGGGCFTGALP